MITLVLEDGRLVLDKDQIWIRGLLVNKYFYLSIHTIFCLYDLSISMDLILDR